MPEPCKAGRPVAKPIPVADRPTVRLKPSSYQPSKAELEADVAIDETPERLAVAALGVIKVEYADEDGNG